MKKPRRKFQPQSPIFIFDYLLKKIGDDTIIGVKHLGEGQVEFVLRSPDGERSVHEVSV